jgi:hypothetical protein
MTCPVVTTVGGAQDVGVALARDDVPGRDDGRRCIGDGALLGQVGAE